MKRISVLLLCAALTAGLCGCADSKSPSSPNSSSEPSSVSDASGGSSAAADIGPESAVDAALKHAGLTGRRSRSCAPSSITKTVTQGTR